MSNPPTRKGPFQGQAAPRDPRRRRPRTTTAGPGQDLDGEAIYAPPPRDVTSDATAVRAAFASSHSAAPTRPAPPARVEPAVRPRRAVSPHASRALAAAPAHPTRDRDLVAASQDFRVAAPARAPPAARAPRGLAAERAAGAASAAIQYTQPRSMPSLEALDDTPAGMTEKNKAAKDMYIYLQTQLEALGAHTKEGMEKLRREAEESNIPMSEKEKRELAYVDDCLSRNIIPQSNIIPQRHRRSRYTSEEDTDTEENKRLCVEDHETATEVDMVCEDDLQSSRPTTPAPSRTSYADQARKTPSPQPTTDIPPAGSTQPPTATPGRKMRYPPLIVENLPNWAFHIKKMKAHLGRSPNVRPFGKGVKFTPNEDQEYRYVQRYLTSLEKTEKISWFSYSLPAERNIKVAIRGLPADTDPEEIMEDLRGQGYDPEYVRPIRARRGRPGCIFLAILRRTRSTIPDIYKVSEIMCMPGVKIEAWRGKKGPSQCFRCQGFRHSSQNCHRQQACVRCGLSHNAHDCPRPLAEPATCANCSGPHPANHVLCPVFRKEARNRRAGTVAATTTPTAAKKPKAAAPQGSNIRTPANEPRARGSAARRRRPRGRRGSRPEQKPQDRPTQPDKKTAPPAKSSGEKKRDNDVVVVALQILNEVLQAVRDGRNPTTIILRGIAGITSGAD